MQKKDEKRKERMLSADDHSCVQNSQFEVTRQLLLYKANEKIAHEKCEILRDR